MRLDPADAQQVHDVVAAVRRVLGEDLVAAYLYGSATGPGLRPDSDLDLLAVVRSPLAGRSRPLAQEVMAVSGRPLRPVELTVLRLDDVVPWRWPPRRELQYGEWLRAEFAAGDASVHGPAHDPDLAVLVTQAREDGVALVGPEPRELLPVVPREDLLRAVAEVVPGLMADLDADTRNVLLTLARVRVTQDTGRIVGKEEAAALVAPSLPDDLAALLLRAAAAYRGELTDTWDDVRDDVRRLAEALTARSGG